MMSNSTKKNEESPPTVTTQCWKELLCLLNLLLVGPLASSVIV